MSTTTNTWYNMLLDAIENGDVVSPRGKKTYELPQHTMVVDMRSPIVTCKDRKLSYQFMAAEAFWILAGDNRVETIAPYNSRIAEFSDDGETFFGAYGPKVMGQIDYIINKLVQDENSRQAGLTIWRENPPDTKDVPCTVAMFFNIRNGKLNCHTFMRSSDIWLGVPYDIFNFSMVAHLVCARLNAFRVDMGIIEPGKLYLTAASRHLYEVNREAAGYCLTVKHYGVCFKTPRKMFIDEASLMSALDNLRNDPKNPSNRWWEILPESSD